MKSILITKTGSKLTGSIALPASKSLSNRLLMMRTLSGKDFRIGSLSDADDTVLLEQLLQVIGKTRATNQLTELDVDNAGTVMRFLTAYLSMLPGRWVLTGSDRMKQRPIGILVEALRGVGAEIDYLGKLGFPPLLIQGKTLTGSEVTIDPGESSQYASALLMIAPLLHQGLALRFKGQAVSTPYMMMTVKLMKQLGIGVNAGKHTIRVKPGMYKPVDLTVEADWSAAAFWYEAAVFAGEVDLELRGLTEKSLQGDSSLATIYENFGIRSTPTDNGLRLTRFRQPIDGFFFNFTDHPDIALPVIATCAALGIRGHFEGLQSLRIKETDRLRALKSELEKLGVKAEIPKREEVNSTLDINPDKPKPASEIAIETYQDHRMAMTFAPLALRFGAIRINNPDVVNKSYPSFWEHMQQVGFKIT